MSPPAKAKLVDSVTLEQAFWIMQRFLEAYWKRGDGHATRKSLGADLASA